MTSDDRCNLVLAFARALFVNGQSTDHTLAAAERLARALGLRASLTARWGELLLRADGKDGALICQAAADPAGVHMGRVASTMRAIADVESGRLAPDAAMKAIGAISRTPPAPTCDALRLWRIRRRTVSSRRSEMRLLFVRCSDLDPYT